MANYHSFSPAAGARCRISFSLKLAHNRNPQSSRLQLPLTSRPTLPGSQTIATIVSDRSCEGKRRSKQSKQQQPPHVHKPNTNQPVLSLPHPGTAMTPLSRPEGVCYRSSDRFFLYLTFFRIGALSSSFPREQKKIKRVRLFRDPERSKKFGLRASLTPQSSGSWRRWRAGYRTR